jgi:hypothetical protein
LAEGNATDPSLCRSEHAQTLSQREASEALPPSLDPGPGDKAPPTPSASPNVKHQHYVWRYYLNAWAANGTFCCYRHKDRQFLPTQPKSVGGETYFY